MYKGKTIICITGLTCSGKSNIAERLSSRQSVIEIDRLVRAYNIKHFPNRKQLDDVLAKPNGIALLEAESFSSIKNTLLERIEGAEEPTVFVDGIQGPKLLGEFVDTVMTVQTTPEKTKEYAQAKGWDMGKLEAIQRLNLQQDPDMRMLV